MRYLDKIDNSLLLAFQMSPGPFHIWVDGKKMILNQEEILVLAVDDGIDCIKLDRPAPEQRWHLRSTVPRRNG